MLNNLSEPNETRLGVSKGLPQGRGVSGKQAHDLYSSIASSKATRSGLVTELSECDLFIDNIGADKVSDITTNIIRRYLVDYTQAQCTLHNVPMPHRVPSGFLWDQERRIWREEYVFLPRYAGKNVLLVPKHFVRRKMCLNSQDYLNKHILEFLQAEHLDARSALVDFLKNGTMKCYKKTLKEAYPCTKEWMATFTEQHPEVLRRYKEVRTRLASIQRRAEANWLNGDISEPILAQALIEALMSIPPGAATATAFHNLVNGIVEFLFWPSLLDPKKEAEIHEGRKRIDVLYSNAGQSAFFQRCLMAPKLGAIKLPIECKNYTQDPANPEVDQIAGRFSSNRGWLGFMVYRSTSDYNLLASRCRDTAMDGRGFILPLGDRELISMLEEVVNERRQSIDRRLSVLLDRIIS